MTDDLVKRPLDEEFDTMMEVQRNPCGAWQAIQTLTEQLEAARADAKEAEAYAEGLERDLKTCCMAQTVMDNTVAELEAKLSTCEEIGRAFEEDAGQPRDKLAKAVEALRFGVDLIEGDSIGHEWKKGQADFRRMARAIIAEIEGEKV